MPPEQDKEFALNRTRTTSSFFETKKLSQNSIPTFNKYTSQAIQPSINPSHDKYTSQADRPSIVTTAETNETLHNYTNNIIRSLSAKEIDYFKTHHGATTTHTSNNLNSTINSNTDGTKNNAGTSHTTSNPLNQPYSLPITKSKKNLALNIQHPDSTFPSASHITTTPRKSEVNLAPLAGIGNEETKSVSVVWEHQDAGVWLDFLQDVSTHHLSTGEGMRKKLKLLSGMKDRKTKKKRSRRE